MAEDMNMTARLPESFRAEFTHKHTPAKALRTIHTTIKYTHTIRERDTSAFSSVNLGEVCVCVCGGGLGAGGRTPKIMLTFRKKEKKTTGVLFPTEALQCHYKAKILFSVLPAGLGL